MSLETEPRVHPKLLEALKTYGIHQNSYLTPEMTWDAPWEAIMAFASEDEESIESLLNGMDYSMPDGLSTIPISKSEVSITGPDENTIKLTIRRPSHSQGEILPAVIHFHSGGMVMLSTDNAMHTSWVEALSKTGLVTIAVDFRNAMSKTGLNPFPKGLGDCIAAVQWVTAHKEELKIDRVILQGESGGANLALAAAINANREGWINAIDGVFATAPYISGAYGLSLEWKLRELPSLIENDGYLISCSTSVFNAKIYHPSGYNSRNSLAWPYWATREDLEGLPPHFIVTNELDPLRDEGNAYYRKLVNAGVRAVAKTNLGVIHEAELFLRQALPDLFLASLWEVKKFADGF